MWGEKSKGFIVRSAGAHYYPHVQIFPRCSRIYRLMRKYPYFELWSIETDRPNRRKEAHPFIGEAEDEMLGYRKSRESRQEYASLNGAKTAADGIVRPAAPRNGSMSIEQRKLPRTRFERVTYCLGGSRSILVSYRGLSAAILCTPQCAVNRD